MYKENVVYTCNYYTAIKKKKKLCHATMWINLEDIMFIKSSGNASVRLAKLCLFFFSLVRYLPRSLTQLIAG